MSYGSASCPCSHRVNRILWGVIAPASMIAKPWMPSSSSSAPGARGGPWTAVGLCPHGSAPRRCQEWTEADVFVALWEQGLVDYDALRGIDWAWLAMDGAMTKAPLGGEKGGQDPDRSRQKRHQAQYPYRRRGRAHRLGRGRGESQGLQDGTSHHREYRRGAAGPHA